jgi:molybdopterin-guanine dinucleotide biosynthesis protein A
VPVTRETWDGVVLCGGTSRRMGRDKATLVVNGEPMVLRVARALHQAGAARIVAVGGDEPALAAALAPLSAELTTRDAERHEAVAVVPDEQPGDGPLGGVLTAFTATTSSVILVVACDLVAPSPDAMQATLARLLDDPDADVAAPIHHGQVEWMHAAWRRTSKSRLRSAFDAGERAIHRAVATAGLTVLRVPGIPREALADADTPADLPG